ncbi:MAG: ankyrin repeat domain-containing protein, partial [Betaproteobacteria bacterium]|nr:ankyrin repeat domain-containing protein [Betaproteobacteria bacterium]
MFLSINVVAAADCDLNSFSWMGHVDTLQEVETCILRNPEIIADRESGSGYTVLHFATKKIPDPKAIRALIKAGAEVNAPSAFGTSPLHYAAASHEKSESTIEKINILLLAGAEVNMLDQAGNTPLHFAAQITSKPEVIKVLLAAGAEIDIRNSSGSTPLHLAAEKNPNPAIVAILIEYGANTELADNHGKTPWDYINHGPITED